MTTVHIQCSGPRLVQDSVKVCNANTLSFKLDWGTGDGLYSPGGVVTTKLISLGGGKWMWCDPDAPNPNRKVSSLQFLSWEYELGKFGQAIDKDGTVPCLAHILHSIAKENAGRHPEISIFNEIIIDGGFA